MNHSARAGGERIFVRMKTYFRRNTLCISRKCGKIRAKIIRRMPKANASEVTKKKKEPGWAPKKALPYVFQLQPQPHPLLPQPLLQPLLQP